MTTVILLIHVMIAIALVGVVLLQRSEGGALGIGGGGGGAGGGFMTGRSAGDALTRTTAILAACFFVTSLTLSILASHNSGSAPTIVPTSGGEGGLSPLAIPGESKPAAPEAPSGPQVPQSN